MHRVGCGEGEVGPARSPNRQHAEREVGRDDIDRGVGERLGARACPGGDIQHILPGCGGDGSDDGAAPPAVLPQGENVIREVVLCRHVVKHRGDLLRVLLQRGATHGDHSPLPS